MAQVSSPCPLFKSIDDNGNEFNLAHYIKKKTIVIFFYPKDNTPGCGLPAVDSLLWDPGCGLLAVDPGCGLLAVDSWLWTPGCGLLAVDAQLRTPGVDSWLGCAGWAGWLERGGGGTGSAAAPAVLTSWDPGN